MNPLVSSLHGLRNALLGLAGKECLPLPARPRWVHPPAPESFAQKHRGLTNRHAADVYVIYTPFFWPFPFPSSAFLIVRRESSHGPGECACSQVVVLQLRWARHGAQCDVKARYNDQTDTSAAGLAYTNSRDRRKCPLQYLDRNKPESPGS